MTKPLLVKVEAYLYVIQHIIYTNKTILPCGAGIIKLRVKGDCVDIFTNTESSSGRAPD